MIEPVHLWPSLIYKTQCPLNLDTITEFCRTKLNDDAIHGLEKNGGKTTFNTVNDLIFDSICDDLRQWLMIVADKVWTQWNFADDIPRFIHRSWVNLHLPGSFTAEHDHGQCHQTIVIYLKQPQNGGNIMFRGGAYASLNSTVFSHRKKGTQCPLPTLLYYGESYNEF